MQEYYFNYVETTTHVLRVYADTLQQATIKAECGSIKNVLCKEGVECINVIERTEVEVTEAI